jgi:hypothetical protein
MKYDYQSCLGFVASVLLLDVVPAQVLIKFRSSIVFILKTIPITGMGIRRILDRKMIPTRRIKDVRNLQFG